MTDAISQDGLSTMATVEQMAKNLGFYDLTSFFLAGAFLVIALAFIVSCAIFLYKKRKERLHELAKVVKEVQEEAKKEHAAKAVLEQKDVAETQHAVEKPAPLDEQVVEEAFEPKEVEPAAAPQPDIPEPVVAPTLPPMVAKETPSTLDGEKQPDFKAALNNTRRGFMAKLAHLFSASKEMTDDDFEEMESILFSADIGVKTAQKLLDILRTRVKQEKNADKEFLRNVLKGEMEKILESAEVKPKAPLSSPEVFMFVGVNGAGKTTSIGKLGAQFIHEGKKVVFGAGDTFRAAAVEQLSIWGERIGAHVISGKENSDSASVLFDAIDKAKHEHADVVFCDTAGRLHTKTSLMDELKKVHRVINKAQPGAPHEVFLVIDATMGQNAIAQAREFAAATPLTGVVLSKLDGTAKGGVAIGIVDELKVPIRYVGVGEKVSDLKPFNPHQFVEALFEEV